MLRYDCVPNAYLVDLKCIALYNYNYEVKAYLAAVNIYNV